MKKTIKTFSHRGYTGSIEVSLEDKCLFGKVLHVDGLLSYSGETIEELLTTFVAVVDEYLADCERTGVDPQKSYSGVFQVRIDPELHRDAQALATRRGESLNQFVTRAVQAFVDDGRAARSTVVRKSGRNVVVQNDPICLDASKTLEFSAQAAQLDDLYTVGAGTLAFARTTH